MKLIELKLKGFIGLKKGMGLDEIVLPLADLAGLVAFDGPNGRGKTTILENLQPFRQFASRKGGLKRHCYAKDSQKELTLEYNGDIIRTLIKMDPQTTRSDEGFIWINDKPMVDGKVTSYDGMIKEIFGSSNLFFWSIFCAQNSKRLTDLTTGKMKELFTEFLRLDRYAVYEDTIKQARGMVEGIGHGARSAAERIESELQKFAGINTDQIIQTAGDQLEIAQAQLEDNEKQINLLQKGIENAKAEIAKNTEKQVRKEEIGQDLVLAKNALITLVNENVDKQGLVTQALDLVRDEIKVTLEMLEGAEGIRQAADRCFVVDTQVKKLSGEIDIAYKARDNMQAEQETLTHQLVEKIRILEECKNSQLVDKAERNMDDLKERYRGVKATTIETDPRSIALHAEIVGLIKRSEALSQKDADCISKTCGLITDAITAEKELGIKRGALGDYIVKWEKGWQKSLTEIEAKGKEAKNHLTALQEKAAAEIKDAEKDVGAVKAKIQIIDDDMAPFKGSIGLKLAQKKTLQTEFDRLSADAKKAPDLIVAAAALSTLEKQEADLKTQNLELAKEYGAKTQAQDKIVFALAAKIGEIKINVEAEEEYNTLVTGLRSTKETHARVTRSIQVNENEILDATRTQQQIEKLKIEHNEAIDNQMQVTYELGQWDYLKMACGKKGLQALEIDGVSPVIEAYANDLLISTFGPMNTMRFETQDDEGKEVLNIVVMDPDGSETMLENKSGGEAVWILKSLRLALTLLSKEKSGRDFKTVLMDEEDGALSPANAVKFIGLYRSMMDIGGFDTCHYISHKQEAIGLANHRMIFTEKGVEID